MTALQWVMLGVFVAVVGFVGWCWVMNWIDAREEERQREAIRHAGPPVLGRGGQRPRHLAKAPHGRQ